MVAFLCILITRYCLPCQQVFARPFERRVDLFGHRMWCRSGRFEPRPQFRLTVPVHPAGAVAYLIEVCHLLAPDLIPE